MSADYPSGHLYGRDPEAAEEMPRHRYQHLDIRARCLYRDYYDNVCGQEYTSGRHHHDEDHPYASRPSSELLPGPADNGCVWAVQNVPEGQAGLVICGRPPADFVHNRAGAASDTVAMVLDVPAEDGGGVGGPWSWVPSPEHMSPEHNLFHCGHPDCVRDAASVSVSPERLLAEEPEPVNPEETLAEASARFLREGGLMTWGPWPVRQFVVLPGKKVGVWGVVEALLAVGEPWLAESWWVSDRVRVVRVQWGVLLGCSAEEVYAAVASWG